MISRAMKIVSVTFLLYAASIITSCEQVPKEYAASDKYRLVWTDDPATTMTIIWDQLKPGQTEILYGKEDYGREYWKYKLSQQPHRTLPDYYNMNTHYAKLQNLEPDQRYYFVLKDDIGVSKRFYFKTAPGEPTPFTFVAGGDTKSSDKALLAGQASNKMVAKLRPLFVLFNGDFTSGNGTDPDRWHLWLNDWDSLTTTADGRKIPIVPMHGNHENGEKSNLNKIFDAPFQGTDSTNIYYSLSFGKRFIHIVALNSEIEVGGDQRKWLEDDLEKHQDYTFKIAGYHKPFWPHTARKGEKEYQFEQWSGLFYKYGLDISLDADSHMHKITYPLKPSSAKNAHMGFVRDDETGTMFIGEGSWGASPRSNDDDKPWTMQSGSFNQIKWIHVMPAKGDQQAHMEIYTVITSQRDETDNQTFHVDNVESLSENDVFKIPENINLFKGDGSQISVRYPYKSN